MIISKALLDGIIITIIICGWISLILKVNPRFEMKSYPIEIVNSVEKQTKNEKKRFLAMAISFYRVFKRNTIIGNWSSNNFWNCFLNKINCKERQLK